MSVENLKCVVCGTYERLQPYFIRDREAQITAPGKRMITSTRWVPVCNSCNQEIHRRKKNPAYLTGLLGIYIPLIGAVIIIGIFFIIAGFLMSWYFYIVIPSIIMTIIMVPILYFEKTAGINLRKYVFFDKHYNIYIKLKTQKKKGAKVYQDWINDVLNERKNKREL
jgi:uncharacterized protein (DUF983 family)